MMWIDTTFAQREVVGLIPTFAQREMVGSIPDLQREMMESVATLAQRSG
jgi:hypothetical protein